MAAAQSQRLRRVAQKASRRKAIVAEKRRAETATMGGREAHQIIAAARSPVKSCVVAERLFADGIGWVVLARTLPSGLVGGSFFLVDVWCLGVKDAFFAVMPPPIFEERMERSSREQPLVDIDPSVARKLLRDAAAYAGSFGVAPSEGCAEGRGAFRRHSLGYGNISVRQGWQTLLCVRSERFAFTHATYPRHGRQTLWSRRF
jgi:hypothetical protein